MKQQSSILQQLKEWGEATARRLRERSTDFRHNRLGALPSLIRQVRKRAAKGFPRVAIVRTGRLVHTGKPLYRAKWHIRRFPPAAVLWLALAFTTGFTVVIIGLMVHERNEAGASVPPTSLTGEKQQPPAAQNGGKQAPDTLPPKVRQAVTLEAISPLAVPVYLSKEKKVDQVPLENYVLGVLAAEMPASFELEALKAQALAARTYIVRRYKDKDFSGVPDRTAWVTDTVMHQAYLTPTQMKRQWGQDYEAKLERLTQAVQETAGHILTYNGKPINAVFFSVGNGFTENAEDYWNFAEPYLRSVSSPWDNQAPGYKQTVTISKKQFLQKLGLGGKVASKDALAGVKLGNLTEGQRIKDIRIGGVWFTGREVREKLGLRSSYFTWKADGDSIAITTYGNGHGVGMSQWGANGMAAEGKTAADIVTYYYQGVQIENEASYLAPATMN